MNPTPSSLLLMGLPASGKTTFLAALWYVVQNARAKSALALDHVVGDTTHLNRIRNNWMQCTPVPRTPIASEVMLSIFLKERATDRPLAVHIPDLAGETFEMQWTERQWSQSYDEMLRGSLGAILFVHPDKVQEPVRIDMVEAMAGEADDAEVGEEPEPEGEVPEWHPEAAATQVKLVEMLQFIAARETSRDPFRIAVVVSAWDTVQASGLNPALWLRGQLPLLDSVLRARADRFPSVVYGLSAQGGEYQGTDSDPLNKIFPLERISLFGDAVVNRHDITEPIRWLIQS